MYLKVQDRRDIVRDSASKAVLNIDNDGLSAYKARRQREQTMNNMLQEVQDLKSDINEIKQLLGRFLENK